MNKQDLQDFLDGQDDWAVGATACPCAVDLVRWIQKILDAKMEWDGQDLIIMI